jgi:hypothetical protein
MSAEARASIIVALILLVAGLGLFFGFRYASNSSRADTADANVLMQAKVIQQQATESQAFSALASVPRMLMPPWTPEQKQPSSNTARYCAVKKRVITLCLLTLLTGCSTTRTVYVPGQCTPLPPELTKPVVAPLPPAN